MTIDLQNYETVEERLSRFKADNPEFRMTSEIVDVAGEIGASRWVVKVTLWKDAADSQPVSVGHAFEIDGKGMANATAALENCETSALGRALANAGYYGNKRVTQQEMRKVKAKEIQDGILAAKNLDELRTQWEQAKQCGLLGRFETFINDRKEQLTNDQAAESTGN